MSAASLFDTALQHHSAGRVDEAETHYRDALHADPHHAAAMMMLAMLANQRGEFSVAIELTRRAIALQPNVRDFHNNLGVFLAADEQFEEAVDAYQNAIAIEGVYPGALSNLGAALKELAKIEESIATCKAAIELQPEHAPAHINLANSLLVNGDLEAGFGEYEWRLRVPSSESRARTFVQPRWDGSALNGRTILLHAEQGFGDTIQFIRFASFLAKRNPQATILLMLQPQLQSLLGDPPDVARVISWDEQNLPPFDVHCPLMSVPYQMGITREAEIIEASAATMHSGYLNAEPRLTSHWLARIRKEMSSQQSSFLKVGLCWTGRAMQSHNRARSLPLDLLRRELKLVPNINWFSLQKLETGSPTLETEKLIVDLSMIDWTSDLIDFTDTAALIENLDVVITIDTSIAHLAGAMGKPTWVLLAHVPDWRYGMTRVDSPWYATMGLFRQQSRGDWSKPIAAIATKLASTPYIRG